MSILERLFILMGFSVAIHLALLAQEGASSLPSIKLTGRVLRQYYCHEPGSEEVQLVMRVQLEFKNTGDEPVILYRKCDRMLRLSRSRTVRNTSIGHVDDESTFTESFAVPHIVNGKEPFPPQNFFVIIRPGEPYLLRSVVNFSYCVQPRVGCATIEPGEHYARAVYQIWKDAPSVGQHLRELWDPFGYLWLDNLTLDPMRFVVDTPTVINTCPAVPKGAFI